METRRRSSNSRFNTVDQAAQQIHGWQDELSAIQNLSVDKAIRKTLKLFDKIEKEARHKINHKLSEQYSNLYTAVEKKFANTLLHLSKLLFLNIDEDEIRNLSKESVDKPNYQTLTATSDFLTILVTLDLLKSKSLARFSMKFNRWAKILELCANNNDYFSIQAIHAALNNTNMQKLFECAFKTEKTIKIFEHFEKIFSDRNSETLRLLSNQIGAVPYFPAIMKDLLQTGDEKFAEQIQLKRKFFLIEYLNDKPKTALKGLISDIKNKKINVDNALLSLQRDKSFNFIFLTKSYLTSLEQSAIKKMIWLDKEFSIVNFGILNNYFLKLEQNTTQKVFEQFNKKVEHFDRSFYFDEILYLFKYFFSNKFTKENIDKSKTKSPNQRAQERISILNFSQGKNLNMQNLTNDRQIYISFLEIQVNKLIRNLQSNAFTSQEDSSNAICKTKFLDDEEFKNFLSNYKYPAASIGEKVLSNQERQKVLMDKISKLKGTEEKKKNVLQLLIKLISIDETLQNLFKQYSPLNQTISEYAKIEILDQEIERSNNTKNSNRLPAEDIHRITLLRDAWSLIKCLKTIKQFNVFSNLSALENIIESLNKLSAFYTPQKTLEEILNSNTNQEKDLIKFINDILQIVIDLKKEINARAESNAQNNNLEQKRNEKQSGINNNSTKIERIKSESELLEMQPSLKHTTSYTKLNKLFKVNITTENNSNADLTQSKTPSAMDQNSLNEKQLTPKMVRTLSKKSLTNSLPGTSAEQQKDLRDQIRKYIALQNNASTIEALNLENQGKDEEDLLNKYLDNQTEVTFFEALSLEKELKQEKIVENVRNIFKK